MTIQEIDAFGSWIKDNWYIPVIFITLVGSQVEDWIKAWRKKD